jgi:hypothetical protein
MTLSASCVLHQVPEMTGEWPLLELQPVSLQEGAN